MMNYEDTKEETKVTSSAESTSCKSTLRAKCNKDHGDGLWNKSCLCFDSVFADDFLFEQLLDYF